MYGIRILYTTLYSPGIFCCILGHLYQKKPIFFDGKPAAVLHKTWGFPAEMGKAEIDGAMFLEDPADFLDVLTLDEKIVEEVQIFSNAKNATYILIQWPC